MVWCLFLTVWFCGSGGRLDLVCNGGARRGPGGRHPGCFWGVRGNQEPSPEPRQTYRLPQGNKAKKACRPWDLKIFVVGVRVFCFSFFAAGVGQAEHWPSPNCTGSTSAAVPCV